VGSLEQAVYAIIISFVIGVILCPIVIPMLRKLKFGQNVRDDGPETHLAKQGTPTMGGVAFLLAFVITSFFFLKGNMDGAAIMLMTLCYGLIGFLDDYIKVVKKRSLGLRAYQKLLLQLIVTGLFCAYILKSGIGTEIYVPFTNGFMLDLGILFVPFLFVAVLGTVNGVNLTDGLDGLAAGVTSIAAMSLMVLCIMTGSTTAVGLTAALAGACMGFLPRNFNPAEIFMGDTGSTFLGFVLAVTSILGVFKGYALLALIVSVLCVGLPVFDTICAMLRRMAKNQPIMQADRGHLHHKLIDRGFSQRQAVLIMYTISMLLGLLAIFISFKNSGTIVVVVMTVIVLCFIIYYFNAHIKNKLESFFVGVPLFLQVEICYTEFPRLQRKELLYGR
jgi:phospho-N-acetylmuramoyl-pentapeptide-transferase